MGRHTLKYIRQVLVRGIAAAGLAFVTVTDYYVVRDVDGLVLYVYIGAMFVCIGALFLTMIPKIRKVSYILFAVGVVFYLAMGGYPAIKEAHEADRCLDSGGGVWDYVEHRCRRDCYHWSRETGCLADGGGAE